MKLRKTQLKEVIRNILLEQEEDWLGDDDEELYGSKIKTKSAEDYRSLLNSAILKEKQDNITPRCDLQIDFDDEED